MPNGVRAGSREATPDASVVVSSAAVRTMVGTGSTAARLATIGLDGAVTQAGPEAADACGASHTMSSAASAATRDPRWRDDRLVRRRACWLVLTAWLLQLCCMACSREK